MILLCTYLQHFGYLLDLLVVGACVSNELQSGSKGTKTYTTKIYKSYVKYRQMLRSTFV
jgi:hypothetical protein